METNYNQNIKNSNTNFNEKNDKYDRQTRLWGEGQYLISTSKILVLGVDSCSLEVLKNLVLSGIGFLTLVDNKKVNEKVLKENFFLSSSSLNKNIAEAALQEILELNEDVKGDFIDIDIKSFISSEELRSKINEYDIVISSNNCNQINTNLSNLVNDNRNKLVILKNNGLINYMRLYSSYHFNLQLKSTDKAIIDFRLPIMWKELRDYCDKFDLEKQSDLEHANTPYVVILYKALEKYQDKYKDKSKFPKNMKDKNEVKEILKEMSRDYTNEINYQEAVNFNYYIANDYRNVRNNTLKYFFILY